MRFSNPLDPADPGAMPGEGDAGGVGGSGAGNPGDSNGGMGGGSGSNGGSGDPGGSDSGGDGASSGPPPGPRPPVPPVTLESRIHSTYGGSGHAGTDPGEDLEIVTGSGDSLAEYDQLLASGHTILHHESHHIGFYQDFTVNFYRNEYEYDHNFYEFRWVRHDLAAAGALPEWEGVRAGMESEGWAFEYLTETNWRDYYQWEIHVITYYGGEPGWAEAYGILGPATEGDPYGAFSETLLESPQVQALYDDGTANWGGSVGGMAFPERPWTAAMRVVHGDASPARGASPAEAGASAVFFPNVYYPFPSVSWTELWYQAETAIPEGAGEVRESLLLHARKEGENGQLIGEWFGQASFTLLEGKRTSESAPEIVGGIPPGWVQVDSGGSIRLTPPIQAGFRNSINLLPVEILVLKEGSNSTGFNRNELVATDKLKVAKWENAFEGSSQNPTVKQNFNELDIDRFYLRVPMPWKEGEGTARVKIKTDCDPENEIEVIEIPGEPGVFRTKGLILVADDVDDDYPAGTDEQLDDVTHKVKLGDTVTFSIPTPGGGEIEIEAKVPKRGTLKLKTWRFHGSGTRSEAQIEEAVGVMRKIFAQIGLDVAHVPGSGAGGFNFENPAQLKLFEYDIQNFEVKFLEEGKTLMEQFSTPGVVDAYFIDSMVGGSFGTMGQAMTDAFVAALPGETDSVGNLLKYTDKVFIKDLLLSGTPPFGFGGFEGVDHVLAHEVLHLPGSIEHEPEKYNLMYSKLLKWTDSPTDQKRISKAQEETVLGLNYIYIELE